MEVSKCWNIVEFPKISFKMKNCKTFYGVQATSRLKEIIHPPPPLPPQSRKIPLLFGTKVFLPRYTEQTFCFQNGSRMHFLGVRNLFARKLVNSQRFLAVLQRHIIFNVKWVEVRKMTAHFWATLYCKMSEE